MKLSNRGKLLLPLLALSLLASACEEAYFIGRYLGGANPQSAPVWSPDGARILFSHVEDRPNTATSDYIYAVESNGSRLEAVSDLSSDEDWYVDYSPNISPDGSRVAFTTFRHKPGWYFGGSRTLEIGTSALDGSDYRRLTDHEALDENPVWSPDGTRIAFVSNRAAYKSKVDTLSVDDFSIYTMAEDGSDVQIVTPSWLPITQDPPVWSPDGRLLAFLVWEPGTEEERSDRTVLHTIAADGSDLRRIAKWPGPSSYGTRPAWSPDGTRIAFATQERNEPATIYTARPDGSDVQEVAKPTRPAAVAEGAPHDGYYWLSQLSWSLDGSEIRFLGVRSSQTLKGSREIENGIHAIKVDGSGARTIAVLYSLDGVWVVWSPDGSRIAVRAEDAGGSVDGVRVFPDFMLYIVAADGSNPRVLVSEQDGRLVLGYPAEVYAAEGQVLPPHTPTPLPTPPPTPTAMRR